MGQHPLGAAAVVVAAILAGCSPTPQPAPPSSVPPAGRAPSGSVSQPPDAVGVSPGGVTTAVGAPADSTEDGYFRACRAARAWMERQGGPPETQIEPYLKMVQRSEAVGPGTFDKKWSELSAGQQSAVIVAVEAAADALCG